MVMKKIKQLRQFIQHPVNFLDQLKANSPELVQEVYLGPKRFVVVFDPDVASGILIQKSERYLQNRAIFGKIKPVTGNRGLVQLQGLESREFRKTARELFTPNNLSQLKLIIEKYADENIDALMGQEKIDITNVMTELILRTAFKMFLGIDIKKQALTLGADFLKLNELCGKKMLSPMSLPYYIPTPANLRIKRLRNALRQKIQKSIKTAPDSLNVVSVFADEETLLDQCMTFLFAGHETTASSLAFTFLLLARHPEYQKRIAEGEEGLSLKVYKESLRLFPPAYMLVREALKDDQLGNVSVKKGDQIIIGLKQIQRLKNYFPNPDLFLPERFDGPTSKAFFPFGKGPKACIGENLAYMEAEIVINAFCKRMVFKKQNQEIHIKPLITLHPENQVLYVS
jgi:cytochrome P450